MNSSAGRPLDAGQITLGMMRHFADHQIACLTEFSLRSGRRADLITLDRQDQIGIVEVKSSVADFRSDQKWPDYTSWADWFCFAVAEGFDTSILPGPDEAGIYITDGFEAELIQPPPEQRLAPARRKSLIRQLARTGMGRASNLALEAKGLPALSLPDSG